MYNVDVYKNTGLNAVNVPESLSWLETTFNDDKTTLPAIDILQNENLQSINVKAEWKDIKDCDYCVIYSSDDDKECYSVSSVQMTSYDVATLVLTYDAVTSAGGAANLVYLDGITERHTVSDDTMFLYTQDDEYTAPREALQITNPTMYFSRQTGDKTYTILESTINLTALGNQFTEDNSGNLNFSGTGITFTDTASNETVTTPFAEQVNTGTAYYLNDAKDDIVESPNTVQYIVNRETNDNENIENGNKRVRLALSAVRSLGFESAIVSQVKYRDTYVNVELEDESSPDPELVLSIQSKNDTRQVGSPYKMYDVKNNRVNYGQYNKYCLITAPGEKGEFLPEQIQSGEDAPIIKMKSDPRPDGRPYYNFQNYLGIKSEQGFWINALGGLAWESVPLTYTGRSGSYLNRLTFDNSSKQAGLAQENSRTQTALKAMETLISGASDVLAGAAYMATGEGGKAVNSFGSALGSVGSAIETGIQAQYNENKYQLERDKELQNYAFSQAVVVPEVTFSFNANVVRDFVGNGVYCCRYRYTDTDAQRIDKILTMYGYKDSVPVTADLFNNRQYFDYVRAQGLSIGGNLSLWKKSLIAQQINAGVRVWHVKPDPAHYTDNPIRS